MKPNTIGTTDLALVLNPDLLGRSNRCAFDPDEQYVYRRAVTSNPRAPVLNPDLIGEEPNAQESSVQSTNKLRSHALQIVFARFLIPINRGGSCKKKVQSTSWFISTLLSVAIPLVSIYGTICSANC